MKLASSVAVALMAIGAFGGRSAAGQSWQMELRDLPPAQHDPGFIEGVSLGLHFVETDVNYAPYLWEVASTGADTVSLVFSWEQESIASHTIAPGPNTPDDALLRATIRSARSLGLDVLVLPILQLRSRGPGEWRGVLAPDDVDAWFASYSEFVLHYASIAEEEGATALSVGSELGSLERHDSRWRTLISAVRDIYGGTLTYSANWDHYFNTPFWDVLDWAGLTGYYELSSVVGENPSVAELVEAWEPFVVSLRAFSQGIGRPVVITEVGYVSQTGAARHPWDYTSAGAVDLGAQLDLYTALYLAWYDEPWLRGIFVWNWFGDGGATDNGYTPRHKPAEQILRHWYGGSVSGAE